MKYDGLSHRIQDLSLIQFSRKKSRSFLDFQSLNRYTNPLRGWRTNRKIVVLESDDWGSIRMPSRHVLRKLEKSYPSLQSCPYHQNDALESNDDLNALLDVLSSIKGRDNCPPLITFNNIVANPDFGKIENSGYGTYHRESFVETLRRYPASDQVLRLYKQGIGAALLKPQLHGAEHINVMQWMHALQRGNRKIRTAFEHRMLGLPNANDQEQSEFMESLDFDTKEELDSTKKGLTYGAEEFRRVWKMSSQTFIAPCYTWHDDHEKHLSGEGVVAIQGIVAQKSPRFKHAGTVRRYHYLGQRNSHQQIYLIRNAFFEPTIDKSFGADHCLKRINLAFKLKKPAIIGTHRLNFIGSIQPENRDRNLRAFAGLLREIIRRWPSTTFMSSDQLTREILI